MIRLIEIDLETDENPLVPSNEPVRIVVRAGDEILGCVDRPHIGWAEAESLRLDLIGRFAERFYARVRIKAQQREGMLGASDVTLVVCARDRPDELEGWLDAASRLDPAPGEILVVHIDSPTDAAKALADRYGTRDVVEADDARNRGWRETSTAIVAYVSDDARVEANYAAAIAGAFLAPMVAAVTGLVLPDGSVSRPLLDEEKELNIIGAAGFERRFFHRDGAPIEAQMWRLGTGANLALRRDVIDAVGGFDRRLDHPSLAPSGGELDMLFRVLEAGHVVLFEPRAIVRTVPRPDERDPQAMGRQVAVAANLAKRSGGHALRRALRRSRRSLASDAVDRKPLWSLRRRSRLAETFRQTLGDADAAVVDGQG